MTTMTMQDVAEAAKTAASKAYATGWYALSRAYTNALEAAQEAIEAEAEEYEATLALYSCFASQEEEEAALEAERVAISAASWARMAAWNAWEAAQAAFQAEEEEEVRAYEARAEAHAAALAEAEEEEGWGDIAIEAMLRDLSSGDREWICGEESPANIAREWGDQGFTSASMHEWAFRARCFRPEAARALTVLGINPEDCRALAPQGDTVGYAVANGDLSPQDAILALQV